jgi:flagellar hook assembly protein FlgD
VDYAVVEGFRVSPTFNAFSRPCEIRYTLQEPATVEIRVTRVQADGQRALVHQVTLPTRETAGPRTAAWRGTGPNGLFAPQGEYVVELYATLDGTDRAESWELTTLMYRT